MPNKAYWSQLEEILEFLDKIKKISNESKGKIENSNK